MASMVSMVNTASTVSMVPTEIMVRAAVNKKTLTTGVVSVKIIKIYILNFNTEVLYA